MKPLALVVAADEARGIGKDGKLPWRLPGEMAYFKRLTSAAQAGRENAVLMGRKTFDSIAPKFRPLPGRRNVVLTRDRSFAAPGALVAHTLSDALAAVQDDGVDRVFVIGGADLYRQALDHPACAEIYLTRVHARFQCDATLAPFEADYRLEERDGPHEEGSLSYTFEHWRRANAAR